MRWRNNYLRIWLARWQYRDDYWRGVTGWAMVFLAVWAFGTIYLILNSISGGR